MLPDYYQILGVSAGANLSVIKAAYKVRAMECHPDRGGSHERMVAVNEAWEILSNATLRQTYDAARRKASTEGDFGAAEENRRTARERAQNYPRKWDDFEKWLRTLSADFQAAEYAEADLWPSVKNSVSGVLFIVIGGLAGFVIAVVLRSTNTPHYLGLLLTAGGAWMGLYIHKCIRSQLVGPEPIGDPDPLSPTAVKGCAKTTIACNKCGQKLRVPENRGTIRVTCPSCKHRFVH